MSHDVWETRVQALEAEGLTRSDAQSVADVEEQKGCLLMSHTKVTSEQIMNYLRANEDDLADSLGRSISDLPPIFALHAAAPSLLRACKDLLWQFNDRITDPQDSEVETIKLAEHAITQAEGR